MCDKEFPGKLPTGETLDLHVQGKNHKRALAALGRTGPQAPESQGSHGNISGPEHAVDALLQFCIEQRHSGLLQNKPAAQVMASFYQRAGANAQRFKAAFNSAGGIRKVLDRSTQRPLRYDDGGANAKESAHRIRLVE